MQKESFILEVNGVSYTCEASKLDNGFLDVWTIEFSDELINYLNKLPDEVYFDTIDYICVYLDNTGLFNEEVFSIHLPI